jgi:hypothetical protein
VAFAIDVTWKFGDTENEVEGCLELKGIEAFKEFQCRKALRELSSGKASKEL